MEENTDRKRLTAAAMEAHPIGGGRGGYAPPPPPEPDPPPPPAPAPVAPEKTKAELQLEQDLAAKEAKTAAQRKGRKSTILTAGMSAGVPQTSSGGVLSYESMTGLEKTKLGA